MIATLLAGAMMTSGGTSLGQPFLAMADGKPISVDVGHADPLWADVNKDGLADLLVGQFGGGTLRVYLNKGTKRDPKFAEFTLMKADGKDMKVEAG